jgi:HAMP domain-containing protein
MMQEVSKLNERFRFPIYLKISSAIFIVILVVVSGMSYITLRRTAREYRQQVTETGNLIAGMVADYSLEPVIMDNYSSLRPVLTDILASNEDIVLIEVLDEEGVSRVDAIRQGNDRSKKEDREDRLDTLTGKAIEVSSPIVAYARTWGHVRVICSLDRFYRAITSARLWILGIAVVSCALGLLMAGLLSKAILTPIRNLVDHAHLLSKGDLDTPINVQSEDEIGFLAITLEGMRVGLRQFLSSVARRAMSFEGDLHLFGFPAVLSLARTGGRTGGLVLEKYGAVGVVYFQDGEVVDAAFADKRGKTALHEFFNWREGAFKFSPGLTPTRITIETDWHALMLEGARRVSDIAVFKHVIHSPDLIPLLRRWNDRIGESLDPIDAPEDLLSSDEKEVFSCVDGARSIREISASINKDIYDIYPHIYRLVAVGLVQVDEYESSQSHGKDLNLDKEMLSGDTPDLGKIIEFPMHRVGDVGR